MKTNFIDMSNEDYHDSDALGSSDARLLAISPLHYKHKERFTLSGEAFSFGSALHALVLEPEKFEDSFVLMPDFNLRTNKGKEDKALFEEKNQDKTILTSKEFDTLTKMASNVNAIAGGILKFGVAEKSLFVKDALGFTRKCRPDYYIESAGMVIDLKTTKNCEPYDFQKAIYDYKYHRQGAWYMDTLRLGGKPVKSFIIIAVEKTAPYMVRVFKMEDEAIEKGREEYTLLLEKYKKYLDTGVAEVVEPISLPKWAFDEEREG